MAALPAEVCRSSEGLRAALRERPRSWRGRSRGRAAVVSVGLPTLSEQQRPTSPVGTLADVVLGQISAIERSPRRLAITSSSFCCAVNFRYLRVSLNVLSYSLSDRSSDDLRTEPRRLRWLASPGRLRASRKPRGGSSSSCPRQRGHARILATTEDGGVLVRVWTSEPARNLWHQTADYRSAIVHKAACGRQSTRRTAAATESAESGSSQ
jgi:hypothetical protein